MALLMAKMIATLLILFLSLNLFSQVQQFEFYGKIKDVKKDCVYLSYTNAVGKTVTDSCFLKKGKFNFKGKISEPTIAYFTSNEKTDADLTANTIRFYLEGGYIKAIARRDRFKEMKFKGSKTQKESEQLKKEISSIENKDDSNFVRIAEIQKRFVTTHSKSYVSAYLLSSVRYIWPNDTLEIFFKRLDPVLQKSYFGKRIAKFIGGINDNSVGKIAREFHATDINGKQIRLADFKGEYVLLNFWASWCGPCRKSTPHLIDLFKEYNKYGLSVIAISGDEDVNAWKEAVKKDRMEIWNNMLSSRQNDVPAKIHEEYAVYAFPTLILIDKNGIIIGRYTDTIEEQFLDKKLFEIFKKDTSKERNLKD
jgi:thiol-disulfide isomerase/thioredoxin